LEIAWHQLENREDFVKRDVTFVNDEGDRETVQKGGFDLFMTLVRGLGERQAVLEALVTTIGLSRPLIEKIKAEAEAEMDKKKVPELTGGESSTPSQANTDGPQSTSSPEPSEKSITG
jgi:hypothetical protein